MMDLLTMNFLLSILCLLTVGPVIVVLMFGWKRLEHLKTVDEHLISEVRIANTVFKDEIVGLDDRLEALEHKPTTSEGDRLLAIERKVAAMQMQR